MLSVRQPTLVKLVVTVNRNGCKEMVDKFAHACHKRFDTVEEAEAFLEEYEEAEGLKRRACSSADLEDMMRRLRMD
jgi:viroplasmin and RNaseH domain-containing protein